MRSFVTLFLAALFLVVVASGLMAFFLPFDQLVTRVHAVCAPALSVVVGWHLFNNRQIFKRHLGSAARRSQVAVLLGVGAAALLVVTNAFPVDRWMALSYENRERDAIFRPPEGAVSRQIEGRIDVVFGRDMAEAELSLAVVMRDSHARQPTAIWAEDESGAMLDTLFLTETVAFSERTRGTKPARSRRELLPVWWHRWQARKEAERAQADLDSLSGACSKGGEDFRATLASESARFTLMIEVASPGTGSQVHSALIDLALLKQHFLVDFLALGLPNGRLGYDTAKLDLGDLSIDMALLNIRRPNKTKP